MAAPDPFVHRVLFGPQRSEPRSDETEEDARRRELREHRAYEASITPQPEVYISVSGLRYRCCGNVPDEEDEHRGHSPWCTG